MLVGEINPSTDGSPPTFRIVQHPFQVAEDEDVRPCEHSSFILDVKWATVTCGECRQKVDPFSALLVYAKWYRDLDARRQVAEEAEKNLCVADLRRLRDLKITTASRRAEIVAMLSDSYRRTIQELAALHATVERENSIARHAKRIERLRKAR